MEIISIQSERTPLIAYGDGELIISGRSYMNDAVEYYRPILRQVSSIDVPSLHVVITLEYFNTTSSKCILELLKLISRKAEAGMNTSIDWKYSSSCPEMHEAGEDYRDLIDGVKFEVFKED